MRSWRNRALLLAGAAALASALPALGQDTPESLLPPGFGDPQSPPPQERPGPTQATGDSGATQELSPLEELEGEPRDELSRPRPSNYFTIPRGAARPVDPAGLIGSEGRGLGTGAFGRSSGPYLAALMRRLDAPLPSRWASILLRRALLSRVSSPAAIHPVDWVAVRTDLLLRMGEADGARLLASSIDYPFYTPRMIEAAARAALATSDPAALCPLVAQSRSRATVWRLTDAMCASLEAEPARASALIDEARRRGDLANVDYLLAEKLVGAGAEARRAAAIDWDEVRSLSAWRLGLAGATGAELPERLVNRAPLAMQAWLARAPMIPVEQRLGPASVAAALGVFSSHSLVEIYSLVLDRADPTEIEGSVGARLRTAWTHEDLGERLEAIRDLWLEVEAPHERHARLILTAGAATRIPPDSAYVEDAATLIASMLTAGLDRHAARWSNVVQEGADDRGWALLALASPRPVLDLSAGRIGAFIDRDESLNRRRSQMLVAGLAGLGRIAPDLAERLAGRVQFQLDRPSVWVTAIERAARAREPGTAALLAGTGLQTASWAGVPPHHLFRIVRALRLTGLDFEARMIAAEALARL
ncbi:MAG: hypothetical protein ACT4OE_09400 [Sphingosinicella sp.]